MSACAMFRKRFRNSLAERLPQSKKYYLDRLLLKGLRFPEHFRNIADTGSPTEEVTSP